MAPLPSMIAITRACASLALYGRVLARPFPRAMHHYGAQSRTPGTSLLLDESGAVFVDTFQDNLRAPHPAMVVIATKYRVYSHALFFVSESTRSICSARKPSILQKAIAVQFLHIRSYVRLRLPAPNLPSLPNHTHGSSSSKI